MEFKTEKNQDIPPVAVGGAEFADRVIRLLIAATEGICSLLTEPDPLREKLTGLTHVLKKAIRPKPISDMGKEIKDFFSRKKLEDAFRSTERNEMKQILVDLTQVLKDTVDSSGGFGEEVNVHIDAIKKTDSLTEIRAIKEKLVVDLNKVRDQSLSLKKEVDSYRKMTVSLNDRLEQTQAQALIDSLTNILNRNAYDLRIGQLIREFDRSKEVGVALMVADIDHFKKFNDNHGHKAGDKILASVAATIQDAIRATDTVFRYGGEEFVVLLNNISPANAEKLAVKVRERVEKDYFIDKELSLKVTVSIGLTCLKEGDTEQTLFERADKAMYTSKQKGRNRVTMAD
jgi:diguanylate cyclase